MNSMRLVVVASLALAAATVSSCGKGGLTDEMRQQEVTMQQETTQWQTELAQMETQHQQMHAWHADHPETGTDTTKLAKLRDHEAKMAKLQEDAAAFKQDLAAHDAKIKEEAARPERDRMTAHAALWANHVKLKATFALLGQAHADFAREHEEFVSAAAPAPTP